MSLLFSWPDQQLKISRWTVLSWTVEKLMPTWTFRRKLHKHRRTIDGMADNDNGEACLTGEDPGTFSTLEKPGQPSLALKVPLRDLQGL